MYLFHIPQCNIQNRTVRISVMNVALWDMEQLHCGICELGQSLYFQGAMLGGLLGFGISSWMSIGSYTMHYYESPLAFPDETCPVRNHTHPGMTPFDASMNLTDMALSGNGTFGHHRHPAKAL